MKHTAPNPKFQISYDAAIQACLLAAVPKHPGLATYDMVVVGSGEKTTPIACPYMAMRRDTALQYGHTIHFDPKVSPPNQVKGKAYRADAEGGLAYFHSYYLTATQIATVSPLTGVPVLMDLNPVHHYFTMNRDLTEAEVVEYLGAGYVKNMRGRK